MPIRRGKIKEFSTDNWHGKITPEDKGPDIIFSHLVFTDFDKQNPPNIGDIVEFEAPSLVKNKKGKLVQGNATKVTIVERAFRSSVLPAPQPTQASQPQSRTPGGRPTSAYNQAQGSMNNGFPNQQSRGNENEDFAKFTYYVPEIPADFQEIVKNPPLSANLGLLLDKYVGGIKEGNKGTSSWLREVFIRRSKNVERDYQFRENFSAYFQRWESSLNARKAKKERLKTIWRLVMHLGRASVIENGTIAMHPVFGFPYLPGQSLKGLTRAYATYTQLPATQPEVFERVFGKANSSQSSSDSDENASVGSVIFFDAIPCKLPTLELDVLTPHFPDWYSNDGKAKAATDNQRVIPVSFLTVGTNNEFLFAVAPRNPTDTANLADAELALDWLVKALDELGAGAKTAAGYGQFQ